MIAPPSLRADGVAYEWDDVTAPIAEAPQALLALIRKQKPESGARADGISARAAAKVRPPADQDGIRKYGDAALDKELRDLANAVPGGRNDALNTAAFKLAQLVAAGALDETTVRVSLETTALNIGLDIAEARKTINSGFVSGMAQPRSFQGVRLATSAGGNVADLGAEKAKRQSEKKAEQPKWASSADADAAILETMNQKFAMVKIAAKTRVMVQEPHVLYPNCLVPEFMQLGHFRDFYNERHFRRLPHDESEKWITDANYWLMHQDRRKFSGVAFMPGRDMPGVFNLWQGFAIQPRADVYPARYLDHLFENICSGNESEYNYLVDWLAFKIQNPGSAAEVCVVLKSGQGAGKGWVLRYLGQIFGPHFRHVTNAKHLTGHFNIHLMTCALLFADEAFFAGDRSHDGVLKALITEPTIPIEAKGLDLIDALNCLGIIMSSNNRWVIPVEHDDRRYFMPTVSEKRKQDMDYFAKLNDEFKGGGAQGLLHFLLNRDISEFNIRERPLTAGLALQKALSRRGVDQLVARLCEDGVLPFAHSKERPHIAITSGEEKQTGFYVAVKRIVADRQLAQMPSQAIAHELRDEWGTKAWTSNGQRGIEFPPLAELRARFEKKFGPQQWPADREVWIEADDAGTLVPTRKPRIGETGFDESESGRG